MTSLERTFCSLLRPHSQDFCPFRFKWLIRMFLMNARTTTHIQHLASTAFMGSRDTLKLEYDKFMRSREAAGYYKVCIYIIDCHTGEWFLCERRAGMGAHFDRGKVHPAEEIDFRLNRDTSTSGPRSFLWLAGGEKENAPSTNEA